MRSRVAEQRQAATACAKHMRQAGEITSAAAHMAAVRTHFDLLLWLNPRLALSIAEEMIDRFCEPDPTRVALARRIAERGSLEMARQGETFRL
ncbi:MAG TPA: hypothetical protein VGS12_17705 [Caulobacteraceae bacterium]|nr:hypothetical protein [Caulobacteraceae bacterium]